MPVKPAPKLLRRSPLKLGIGAGDKDSNNHCKKGQKRSGKKKKWLSSEDESELGELPPPPVIISDPNSMMPEKGILKNSCPKLAEAKRGGSDSGASQQRGSESGGSYVDQDSVGTYNYDDDDDMEIREIFRDRATGCSMENLDNMPESASFDFVIPPPPPPQFLMQSIFPSPPSSRLHRGGPPPLEKQEGGEGQPLLWRTPLPPHTLSPPQSRIVRLRNFNDLLTRFDKTTVDLSPSPDEPPVQLSPSTCTSEDVRSSETEPDRLCYRTSHSDHSPTSVASSSTTQHTFNTHGLGNLNQYLLKTNNLSAGSEGDQGEEREEEEEEEATPSPHPVHMPPPMNPITIRSIMAMGHAAPSSVPANAASSNNTTTTTSTTGESSDTPHSSQDGASLTGTATSKNGGGGYDKSSGYGSEHDLADRLSLDDNTIRSPSTSPPSYSAVIRTGPNQIQLVAPGRLRGACNSSSGDSGSQEELQRLLEGLPRIDAGSFERSPLLSGMPSNGASNPLLLAKAGGGGGGVGNGVGGSDELSNLPCIDRSLEEIPQALGEEEKKSRGGGGGRRHSQGKRSKRPISLCVGHQQGSRSPDSQSEGLDGGEEHVGKRPVLVHS